MCKLIDRNQQIYTNMQGALITKFKIKLYKLP